MAGERQKSDSGRGGGRGGSVEGIPVGVGNTSIDQVNNTKIEREEERRGDQGGDGGVEDDSLLRSAVNVRFGGRGDGGGDDTGGGNMFSYSGVEGGGHHSIATQQLNPNTRHHNADSQVNSEVWPPREGSEFALAIPSMPMGLHSVTGASTTSGHGVSPPCDTSYSVFEEAERMAESIQLMAHERDAFKQHSWLLQVFV